MCRWAYFIAATLVACATAAVGVDEDGHRVHVKPRAGANLRGTVDAKDPPGSNGYCPHHKLVNNPSELTACSAAGKCDPVSDAMTRDESYECLGQHWDMPDEPKPADSEQIPRVVHLVLSDHGTRAFDWTCWVAIKAVQNHMKPTKIMVHILDNVEPWSGWWQEVKKLPEVVVMPFSADDVPKELNGHKIILPAHLSDFRRFDMMYQHGGCPAQPANQWRPHRRSTHPRAAIHRSNSLTGSGVAPVNSPSVLVLMPPPQVAFTSTPTTSSSGPPTSC
jgi:hypothetical protein